MFNIKTSIISAEYVSCQNWSFLQNKQIKMQWTTQGEFFFWDRNPGWDSQCFSMYRLVCLTESMMITIAHGCSSTKHWRFWNVLIQPQVISVTCSPVRWAAEVKSESCLRMANASWLCNCRSPWNISWQQDVNVPFDSSEKHKTTHQYHWP